jgi:hypothetical protein
MTSRHRAALDRFARILASLLFFSGALIAIGGLGAGRAAAADNGRWSIFPTTAKGQVTNRGYFQPLLTPGVPLRDSVTVTNETHHKQTFRIYGSDAYNSPSGLYLLKLHGQHMRNVGAWIHLPVTHLTLPPRTFRNIPFTIRPPGNATPGDHAGGIVLEPTRSTLSKTGAVQVHQIDAVGVRVYARVRGPLTPSLAITSLHINEKKSVGSLFGGGTTATATYTVTNTGNVNLIPTGQLTLNAVLGSSHKQVTLIPQLLPGGSATISQTFKVAPSVILRAHLTVTAPPNVTTTASATSVNIPWLLLAVIVALLGGLYWWRRRRRQQRASGSGEPPEQESGRHREATRT